MMGVSLSHHDLYSHHHRQIPHLWKIIHVTQAASSIRNLSCQPIYPHQSHHTHFNGHKHRLRRHCGQRFRSDLDPHHSPNLPYLDWLADPKQDAPNRISDASWGRASVVLIRPAYLGQSKHPASWRQPLGPFRVFLSRPARQGDVEQASLVATASNPRVAHVV